MNKPTSAVVVRVAASAAYAVGIDLGTTSSAIALIDESGAARIVADAHGKAIIPSVVHVKQDGSVLVGQAAVDASVSNAANTFYSVKRLLGRPFAQVKDLLPGLTFSVTEGPDGTSLLALASTDVGAGTATMSPEQVSAHIVRHLLERAQGTLGDGALPIREAVVTIPAYFGVAQRKATVEAAKLAGLQKVTLLQEPVAAAMAYGFGKPTDWDTLLVFDLGGGTLDLSLLEVFDGIMEVVETGGDAMLGGDDFTAASVAMVTSALPDGLRMQLLEGRASPGLRLALRHAAEEAKVGLSEAESVSVALALGDEGAGVAGVSGGGALQLGFSAGALEAACSPLVTRLWPPLERLATDTRTQYGGAHPADGTLPGFRGVSASDAESAGGSGSGGSGGSTPGAPPARAAAHIGRTFSVFKTVTAPSESVQSRYAPRPRTITGVVLVGAATRMPAVRALLAHVTGLPPADGVDPEEVVALGAATHAGVMLGCSSGIEMADSSYVAKLHDRAAAMLSDWQP
ncbi:hypothetical protein FOA52_015447 [Chlamydomonas sp. UWO 241]|nr:hypothetical protein FOA52_015447 [Chlamydomonas sp. UWO 241]